MNVHTCSNLSPARGWIGHNEGGYDFDIGVASTTYAFSLKCAASYDDAHGALREAMYCFTLLNDGLSTAQLAKRCVISEGTVKWYLHNLYAKLGVGNRTALLRALTPDESRTADVG